MLRVKSCDVAITRHLREGGDIYDEAGTALARKIAHESLQMERVRVAANARGFGESMLAEVYQCMIASLMPEPLIRHGGPVLAPSLIFMDDARFSNQLDLITNVGSLDPRREADFDEIKHNAALLATELKGHADAARGSIQLADTRSAATGCGANAVILLLAFGGTWVLRSLT